MVHHVVPGWLGVLTHFIFVGCCCSLCRKVMCSCWETTATTALIPTTGTSQATVIRPVTLEMHRYAWIVSNVLPLQGSTSSEEHCREIYPPVLAAIEDQWYNLWAWCVPPRGAVLVVVAAVTLDIQCVCVQWPYYFVEPHLMSWAPVPILSEYFVSWVFPVNSLCLTDLFSLPLGRCLFKARESVVPCILQYKLIKPVTLFFLLSR